MRRKIDHLSISSLKLHAYSPAKWCLTYLEGLREPPTEHLRFGQEIHSLLEYLYAHGPGDGESHPTLGRHKEFFDVWWEENKEWFLSRDWNIEESFRIWLSPELPPFEGRIDMWRMRNADDGGTLEVVDHKTATKGFELNQIGLENDWQMSLYVHALNPRLSEVLYEDCVWSEEWNDEVAAYVGHNQLYKNKSFELKDSSFTGAVLTRRQLGKNIHEIKEEAHKVLTTISTYDKLGIDGVKKGQAQERYFGKRDYHWPLISKQIDLEEFKRTLGVH